MKPRIIANWAWSFVPALVLASSAWASAGTESASSPATGQPVSQAKELSSEMPAFAPRVVVTVTVPPGPTAAGAPERAPEANAARATLHLSAWAAEIEKLARAGIEEGVLLSYIDAAGTFNLGSDQIIYLRDQGVSPLVLSAMIQHDADVISGRRQVMASTAPPSPSLFGPKRDLEPAEQPARSLTSLQPPTVSLDLVNERTRDSRGTESMPEPVDRPPETAFPIMEPMVTQPPELSQVLASAAEDTASSTVRGQFPVREPFPVPLTDPIIIVRAHGRVPNLQVLVSFP